MDKRIVSLVPSLTHTICNWGGRSQLVGVTKFCNYPSDLHRSAAIIGGPKDPSIKAIADLKPTHIIANDEENKPEHISELLKIAKVHVNSSRNIADLAFDLNLLGEFLGETKVAQTCASDLEYQYKILKKLTSNRTKRSYLYFIWKNPYMVAGTDTYIDSMMRLIGFENAYTGLERYPQLTVEEIVGLAPQSIFLSSEPYSFRTRDKDTLISEGITCPQILKADGRYLSWYGALAIESLSKLNSVISSGGFTSENTVFADFKARPKM